MCVAMAVSELGVSLCAAFTMITQTHRHIQIYEQIRDSSSVVGIPSAEEEEGSRRRRKKERESWI